MHALQEQLYVETMENTPEKDTEKEIGNKRDRKVGTKPK